MKHKIRPFIIILVVIGAISGGYWYFTQNPEELIRVQLQLGLISESEAGGEHSVSGFIEAEEISVAAETNGRITRITIDEGDFVEAGQVLVELDIALLEAQVAQAQARITTAKAQLAKLKAGIRTEEIYKAKAAVTMAQANAEAAHVLWQNAMTLRDNPQELDMQIDAARTALELIELKIAYAIPLKDAGETLWELRQRQWTDVQEGLHISIPGGRSFTANYPEGAKQDTGVAWNLAGADMWAAWVDLNGAIAERDHTQVALDDLLQLRNDPQEAHINVAEASAAYQTALVEVEVAQAQLELLKAGFRSEELTVAQAQVEQTEANLATLNVQRDKYTLLAPLAGWVVKQIAHEGEMAVPGTPLLTLADLTNVTLTVYVPEPDIDTVSIGQKVDVFVDSFPNKPFTGYLTFINNEAEFTPKNVQTKEERVNTVFAVKIKLDNKDRLLKPGTPADAILAKGQRLQPVINNQ